MAAVPLKNKFSAVTDTVRFSHAGRLGASTVLVGWSTVALNNTAEVMLLTSTKYLNIGFPPGGIPVALFIKAVQEMTVVTGNVPYDVMTADRPLGALGGSALNDRIAHGLCMLAAKQCDEVYSVLTIDKHLGGILQIPCNYIKLHSPCPTGRSTGVVATIVQCGIVNGQVGHHHCEITDNCEPLWGSHQDRGSSQIFLMNQFTILEPQNIVHRGVPCALE